MPVAGGDDWTVMCACGGKKNLTRLLGLYLGSDCLAWWGRVVTLLKYWGKTIGRWVQEHD